MFGMLLMTSSASEAKQSCLCFYHLQSTVSKVER